MAECRKQKLCVAENNFETKGASYAAEIWAKPGQAAFGKK